MPKTVSVGLYSLPMLTEKQHVLVVSGPIPILELGSWWCSSLRSESIFELSADLVIAACVFQYPKELLVVDSHGVIG